MVEKLDRAPKPVNRPLAPIALIAIIAACGPSPRPVPPALQSAWPTPQGNVRRAPFENEWVPDSLSVVWDIDAGAGLRASVLATDSAIFVGTTNRALLAFSTRTGRRHWDQRAEGQIPAEIVRSGRTLFFATAEWNGRVHARDMERGRKVWQYDAGPMRFSPLLDGGLVYVGTERGQVHALRSEDGARVWRRNVSGSVAATPVSHDDALLVVTELDSIYRISKRDGAIMIRAAVPSSVSAAPALSGDTIVIVTHAGNVIGVNAHTLQQQWRVETNAPILAAPIISRDGAIHVINRDATIWRITNRHGTRVAALGGAAGGSFTLARDRYIVGRTDGTLLITDLAGTVISEHRFNDSVVAPVVVQGGALYVPLLRGRIVKLR